MRIKIVLLLSCFFFLIQSFGQTKTITGKITDEKANPIPFAVITIKGTKTGTQADAYGLFKLNVKDSQTVTLVINAVGFQSREYVITKETNINLTLVAATSSLDEVVITTALGIQKQRELSYSVSTISNNRLNFSQPLSGKVAGLRVQGVFTKYPRKKDQHQNRSDFNTEEYDPVVENIFHKSADEPLSTFSIDVDGASYSNIRRFLNDGELPPVDAVRIEEMVNYFRYNYQQLGGADPFSIHAEVTKCPWNNKHQLVMIGLQGKQIPIENLPPSNIVFLIDVSGSMDDPLKLPLVQSSMKLLVDQLREQDKISIVVYAGAAGLVLPSSSGANKMQIKDAIDKLEAGGSTAGGEGIQLAYKIARENFMKEGNNRIVLCTDGDFNVGVSSNGGLEKLIEKERESGVFLTVLGFGMGNYKDSKMEILANKGNGNHAYIDSEKEAMKVLVNEFGGTLFTIAKDVKLQIEFNPVKVQAYRLIGYENRSLNKEDFKDDKKDAGELGSGHTVTALYEVIPAGIKSEFLKDVDPLKYQKKNKLSAVSSTNEMLTVKFRYKEPKENTSKLMEHVVLDNEIPFEQASENLRFASAVAEFGLLLRNSKFRSASSFEQVIQTASSAITFDREGYRKEFIALVEIASELKKQEKDITKN